MLFSFAFEQNFRAVSVQTRRSDVLLISKNISLVCRRGIRQFRIILYRVLLFVSFEFLGCLLIIVVIIIDYYFHFLSCQSIDLSVVCVLFLLLIVIVTIFIPTNCRPCELLLDALFLHLLT